MFMIFPTLIQCYNKKKEDKIFFLVKEKRPVQNLRV